MPLPSTTITRVLNLPRLKFGLLTFFLIPISSWVLNAPPFSVVAYLPPSYVPLLLGIHTLNDEIVMVVG